MHALICGPQSLSAYDSDKTVYMDLNDEGRIHLSRFRMLRAIFYKLFYHHLTLLSKWF